MRPRGFEMCRGSSPVRPGQTGRRAGAFTLVELLVVIIIIGILAAIAIPQFGDTSSSAKVAALDQNLSCLRAAIELFYYHHGKYPGAIATHKAGGASATATAHSSAADAFVKQLIWYSNANGDTCDTKDAAFPFGPYLRRAMPENPLPADTCTGAGTAAVTVTADTTALAADVKPATGWKTSNQTGEFIANNLAYSSR